MPHVAAGLFLSNSLSIFFATDSVIGAMVDTGDGSVKRFVALPLRPTNAYPSFATPIKYFAFMLHHIYMRLYLLVDDSAIQAVEPLSAHI